MPSTSHTSSVSQSLRGPPRVAVAQSFGAYRRAADDDALDDDADEEDDDDYHGHASITARRGGRGRDGRRPNAGNNNANSMRKRAKLVSAR